MTSAATTRFAQLIRIAIRLGKVTAGSRDADHAIQAALGLPGEAPAYTSDEAAARGLLPAGFEWHASSFASDAVYATCRRAGLDGNLPHPHHEQWGRRLRWPGRHCGRGRWREAEALEL